MQHTVSSSLDCPQIVNCRWSAGYPARMNKHCSYNPHLPYQQINWGMPFGNEFLYNHPACLLGAFNWDKRAEIVSGWRQVVRRICFLCWIIHLTLLERIEKHITSMTQVGMCVSVCARTQTFILCVRRKLRDCLSSLIKVTEETTTVLITSRQHNKQKRHRF